MHIYEYAIYAYKVFKYINSILFKNVNLLQMYTRIILSVIIMFLWRSKFNVRFIPFKFQIIYVRVPLITLHRICTEYNVMYYIIIIVCRYTKCKYLQLSTLFIAIQFSFARLDLFWFSSVKRLYNNILLVKTLCS